MASDAYIATSPAARRAAPRTKDADQLPEERRCQTRMARKIRQQEGAKIYAQRKASWSRGETGADQGSPVYAASVEAALRMRREWHLIAATQTVSCSGSDDHSKQALVRQRMRAWPNLANVTQDWLKHKSKT